MTKPTKKGQEKIEVPVESMPYYDDFEHEQMDYGD